MRFDWSGLELELELEISTQLVAPQPQVSTLSGNGQTSRRLRETPTQAATYLSQQISARTHTKPIRHAPVVGPNRIGSDLELELEPQLAPFAVHAISAIKPPRVESQAKR
ncbi:hypothetical protein ACLKA7_014722 [Drosophila subpalustris]